MSKILLVEDDPISARLTTNLLAELEVEIVHVLKGEDAVAFYLSSDPQFDLVLMDLYLPGITGFKATEGIRASEYYQQRPVPIIALTSNALMENKQQFLQSTGFTEYVTKPARKDTFPALVRKHLPPPKLASLSWY